MAVTQRVLTDNAYGAKVLINFDGHGSAVTIDASALANKEASGDRL